MKRIIEQNIAYLNNNKGIAEMEKKTLIEKLDDLVDDAEDMQDQLKRIQKRTEKRRVTEIVAGFCLMMVVTVGIISFLLVLFIDSFY